MGVKMELVNRLVDGGGDGTIARELVRGTREEGGLLTLEDLDRWEVKIEALYIGLLSQNLPDS